MPTINIHGGGAGAVPPQGPSGPGGPTATPQVPFGVRQGTDRDYISNTYIQQMAQDNARRRRALEPMGGATQTREATETYRNSIKLLNSVGKDVAEFIKAQKREEGAIAKAKAMAERESLKRAQQEQQGELRVAHMEQDSQRQRERTILQERRQQQVAHHKREMLTREEIQAFNFGGMIGGAVGGAVHGDVGAVVGSLAAGFGGGLGFIGGAALGSLVDMPMLGGAIGKALGTSLGELAGLFADPYAEAYRGSKPYYDYELSAFSLGRQRNQSGKEIDSTFFRGSGRVASALQGTGMQPQEALEALASLGYTPKGDLGKTIGTISGLEYRSSAFANLPTSSLYGVLGRGGAYGYNSPSQTGPGAMQPVIDTLSDAQARGLDKSKLLDSIERSMDELVQQGGQGSPKAISEFVRQMSYTNQAGGLTGANAASIISGNAAAGQHILGSNMGTLMLQSQLPKFNYFKSPADIAKFTGMPLGSLPPGIVRDAMAAAKSGNYNFALEILSNPAAQAPGHLNTLFGQGYDAMGLPAYMKRYWMSQVGGGNLGANYNQDQTAGLPATTTNPLMKGIEGYNGKNPQYAPTVAKNYANMFKTQLSGDWNKNINSKQYIDLLTKGGVPAGVAAMIVKNAERDKINPLLLAAVGKTESGFDAGAVNYNKNGSMDYGMFQINSSNFGKFPNATKTLGGNIAAGADILAWNLRRTGGTTYTDNVPTDALEAREKAGASELGAAYAVAEVLMPAADKFQNATNHFFDAVNKFYSAHQAGMAVAPSMPTTTTSHTSAAKTGLRYTPPRP